MWGKAGSLNKERKGIYLREGGDYVGPFRGREDVERFLTLMEVLGESRAGIEIVGINSEMNPGRLNLLDAGDVGGDNEEPKRNSRPGDAYLLTVV